MNVLESLDDGVYLEGTPILSTRTKYVSYSSELTCAIGIRGKD